MSHPRPSRLRTLRALAVSSLPPLVALWALWRDVYRLDASGLHLLANPPAIVDWTLLSTGTVGIGALAWAPSRPLRVLGYAALALVLAVAFGVTSVLGVMYAFGGPSGELSAPTWALTALVVVAAWCVASLLATAGLVVEDVRAGDAGSETAEEPQDPCA
jgi:hypothetical protein